MNKNRKFVIAVIIQSSVGLAYADATNVTFTATVTQSPCTLQEDSKNQTVPYGGFTTNEVLSTPVGGGIIANQDFSLVFDCPIGIKNINVSFSGISSPVNSHNLYNQMADGTKGIVVGILAQNELVDFASNKIYTYPVTTPGVQTLIFPTQLERTTDEPFSLGQTGEFKAISTINFTYD